MEIWNQVLQSPGTYLRPYDLYEYYRFLMDFHFSLKFDNRIKVEDFSKNEPVFYINVCGSDMKISALSNPESGKFEMEYADGTSEVLTQDEILEKIRLNLEF